MISEVVATAEDMLYTDKKNGTICRIFIKNKGAGITLEYMLHINEVIYGMGDLLEWAVDTEEYELAHRIKLINEYVCENGIRETVTGLFDENKG